MIQIVCFNPTVRKQITKVTKYNSNGVPLKISHQIKFFVGNPAKYNAKMMDSKIADYSLIKYQIDRIIIEMAWLSKV